MPRATVTHENSWKNPREPTVSDTSCPRTAGGASLLAWGCMVWSCVQSWELGDGANTNCWSRRRTTAGHHGDGSVHTSRGTRLSAASHMIRPVQKKRQETSKKSRRTPKTIPTWTVQSKKSRQPYQNLDGRRKISTDGLVPAGPPVEMVRRPSRFWYVHIIAPKPKVKNGCRPCCPSIA